MRTRHVVWATLAMATQLLGCGPSIGGRPFVPSFDVDTFPGFLRDDPYQEPPAPSTTLRLPWWGSGTNCAPVPDTYLVRWNGNDLALHSQPALGAHVGGPERVCYPPTWVFQQESPPPTRDELVVGDGTNTFTAEFPTPTATITFDSPEQGVLITGPPGADGEFRFSVELGPPEFVDRLAPTGGPVFCVDCATLGFSCLVAKDLRRGGYVAQLKLAGARPSSGAYACTLSAAYVLRQTCAGYACDLDRRGAVVRSPDRPETPATFEVTVP